MQQEENIHYIYPIPFETFLEHRKSQEEKECPKLHEFHKLKKLKKMLQETEKKIENRIRLFKKVSHEIIKKKQKEKDQQMRKEQIRKNICLPIKIKEKNSFPTNHRSHKNYQNEFDSQHIITNYRYKSSNNESFLKNTRHNLTQIKYEKAQNLKMEKIKYKMLIEQNKKRDLRKKMQSAGHIRKDHGQARLIRQKMQKEKQKNILQNRKQKYLQEQEEYDQLKKNLTRLQLEERQALIQWKKTIDF